MDAVWAKPPSLRSYWTRTSRSTARSPPDLSKPQVYPKRFYASRKRVILALPDPKHATNIVAALEIGPKEKCQVPSKKANLENRELLSAGKAGQYGQYQYRSAVGSAIYLSADRRDIQFAVKELARHMLRSSNTWRR